MIKIKTISTNQIIIYAIIVIVTIMTFQFVYHLRATKAPNPTLSPDVGLIFPSPRDILSFELVTENQKRFTQQNFYHHWTLLFFGFTHCSSICPTTLDMISRAYPELQKTYPNLQVVLISLDPERDTVNALINYTRSFNPDFIGVTGKIEELRKLQSQLGIFSARDSKATPTNNYQIQHTSSILLINPQGKWAGLFKYGLSPTQFSLALKTAVRGAQ